MTGTTPMLEPGTFPLDKVTHEVLDSDDRHGDLLRNRHAFSAQDAIEISIDSRRYTEEITREDAPDVFAAIDAYFARTIDTVVSDIRAAGFEPTTVDPTRPVEEEADDEEGDDEGESQ